jgi:beta-lactamase class A
MSKNQTILPQSNPWQKKIPKRQLGFGALFIFIGVFIGWFITTSAIHKSSSTIKNQEIVEENLVKPDEFCFTNPTNLTEENDEDCHKNLSNLKRLVENYCLSTKKDKSIEQISFYFRDFTNNRWIGVNETEKFIPASLTKVPIMIAVFQIAQKDPTYLKKKLKFEGSFTSRYLKEHPEIDDVRTVMEENVSYPIEQLVNLMITKSDNEAAMMLYNDFGQKHWDALQKLLGNGAPIAAPLSENILTVKSYSSFFRILYNSSLLNKEYSEKALEILSRSEYNKGIRQAFPSNIKICHKYGERDTAVSANRIEIQQLHHAGIVYFPGKTFFLCVMTKGTDKVKMQNIIADLAKIANQQVELQIKDAEKPVLAKDIN